MIVAKEVTKTLGGARILRGVTVTIPAGGLTAIVGPSGSGKSTFLSLLAGLDRADGGALAVDGVDLVRASDAELTAYRRDRIGVVLQFFHLLPTLTALENVALAGPARAAELLAKVGLADAAHRFPAQLSGGMQQRVAIARALAKDPKVLFADEPTGALDQASGRAVFSLVKELARTVTCVMVTHDPALAAEADRIVRFEDGVTSPGSPR